MYQYWLQTADADVVRYLKLFTFLEQDRIRELEQEVATSPEKREAQRVLAEACTGIVHGEDAVLAAEAASRILFQGSDEVLNSATVNMLADEMPVTGINRSELESGIWLIDLLVRTRLAESKRAARKLIEGGGVYLNNERQNQAEASNTGRSAKGKPGAILLRTGKKTYHLVRVG